MPVPHRRRGMMLVVTLVIVTLLALLGASFSFRMNADVASVSAQHDLQQARQAAESGLDRAIMILREHRTDMDEWYNNPKYFRRILVWAPDKIGGSESVADQEKVAGRPAWRFSIISYRLDGDDAKIRYGVSDEAGKINVNTASRAQLIALFDNVKHDDNITSIELADAILHWRGDESVPDETAAKLTDFYNKRNPSYKPKQRPFETIEELLMLKGFDGQLVYGEDYNRNGYLDSNEDDGQDGAFPPDDGDSKLNRGLLPLVTCYSWDRNASNDNRQRVNINMANLGETTPGEGGAGALPGMSVRELLSKEIRPEVLDFIADARKRNFKFRSVGELVGLEVYQDGSSNYDRAWRSFLRQLNQANRARSADEEEGAGNEDGGREGDRDRDGGRDTGGGLDAGGRDGGGSDGGLGPRRDNTRTAEDRRREREEERDRDNDDSDGGPGRSDAGPGEARFVLAGFTGGVNVFPRVIPSVLLASTDTSLTDDKDARKLQSARGSSRGGSGSSGSGRSGSSRGGSSSGSGRSGGGRSFGLGDDDENTNNGSNSGNSGSSRGSGRGSGGRGSGAGSSRDGDSAGGSDSDGGDDSSGSRRGGGRRGGSGRDSDTDGGGNRGSGRGSSRDDDAGSDDGSDSGGRGGGRDGGRRGDDRDSDDGEGPTGGRGRDGEETGDNNADNGENEPQQENNGAGGGTGGRGGRGTPIVSPVTADDLPALLDRLTTLPMPVLAGQINVNTATVEVLRTLPGVGEAEAEAIVAKRAQLSGVDKITPSWLVSSGALAPEQFALISNLLTTRSLQYTVETIGFADHVGAAKRIQAVVEFKGQMAQIKYYRDITSLGIGYPVHDDERSEGFAFTDR